MMDKRRAFGEELAGRRSEKGVSLDEMAKVTKVRKPILEALEAGRLEELPPEVFTAGFLRVYASHLGLNPSQVVSQYRRLTAPPVPADQGERATDERHAWPGIAGTALVLAAVVGAAAWLWWSYREGRWPFPASREAPVVGAPLGEPGAPPGIPPASVDPSPGPAIAAQGTEVGTSGGMPPALPPSPPPSGGSSPASAAASNEPAEPAPIPPHPTAPAHVAPTVQGDVVLACTQSCWLEMWADGKRVVYRQVTPGERLAFSGQRFRFNIGNTAGLQMTWHGQPVALPQENGRVLKDFVLPVQPEGGSPP